jgi:hypothetical protein
MMSNVQPQLLQMALDKKDVVYTPDWVARDMVEFFKPTGRILEPSAGDGAFLKYLPGADWCEIEKGRDFFACQEHYDWIIGNPPYAQFREFLFHSFELAKDIVFVLPVDKPFNSYPNMNIVRSGGGIKHMRIYKEKVFTKVTHRPTGAFHFQRGYTGPMYTSFYEAEL